MRDLKLLVNKIAACIIVLILFINISIAKTTFVIYEGNAPGDVVGNLNSTILAVYPLTFFDKFLLNKTSGIIKSVVTLDREDKSSYKFVAITHTSKNIRVEIQVKDINDEFPIFSTSNKTVTISEAYDVGHIYNLDLQVADKDEGLNGIRNDSVRILSGNVGSVFKIVLKKHDKSYAVSLELAKKLNWSAVHKYVLNISASDNGSPRKISYMKLTVIVQDYNTCPPRFSRSSYVADVSESVPQGTRVLNITTSDCDGGENAEVVYTMNHDLPYDPGRYFGIHQKGRIAHIVTNLKLDFEKTKNYRLQVVATDKGRNPKQSTADVTVYVRDENDNDPEIGTFHFYPIDEDAKVDSRVAKIKIYDKDSGENGKLNVSLDPKDVFSIVKISTDFYEVYLKAKLDYERQQSYHIIVTATDNGKPSRRIQNSGSLLVGDINDNPPKFDQDLYTGNVVEPSNSGASVVTVHAADKDHVSQSNITYRIMPANNLSWFEINSTSGVIYVVSFVDREQSDKVTLVIQAYDGRFSANCTVVLHIVDSNDNAPQFSMSHYTMTVFENLVPGEFVGKVNASDPDLTSRGHIVFSLSHPAANVFTIDSTTGNITTLAKLDREKISTYNFSVIASDEDGLQSTAKVTVLVDDVNDNRPFFTTDFYNYTVFENVSIGSNLVKLEANDFDIGWHASISYEIHSGNDDGTFALDKSDGQVSIHKKLDREKVERYVLTFRAIDNGGLTSPNLATVEILVKDVNDDPPVFQKEKYTFYVKENGGEFVFVGTVVAKSYDQGSGGIVSYSIKTLVAGQYFSVNDSGAIFTVANLDHEVQAEYELLVEAKDHGTPTLFGYVNVTIVVTDINDNSPIWNDDNHCIGLYENHPVGEHAVFHVFSASDKDSDLNGKVMYSIVSGPDSVFHLNARNGSLSLNAAVDYEKVQLYQLILNASDSGRPVMSSLLHVNICIIDVNDNAPVLHNASVAVSEDLPVNAPIYTFHAVDKDSGEYGRVWYKFDGITPDNFELSNDGVLTLKLQLDREKQDKHEVYILAGDHGNPFKISAPAKLIIDVTDVNDEAPFFTSKLSFETTENNSPGTFIGKLEAKDRDLGNNSKIEYSLVNYTDTFEIDLKTGKLFSIVELDREKIPVYRVQVQATDKGVEPRHTTVIINIRVRDINDNFPVFTKREYYVKVSENVVKGTKIAKVEAEDRDEGQNGEVIYYLSTGNSHGGKEMFQINETTGYIFIVASLDREIKDYFVLSIVASDKGHPPKDQISRVFVAVQDVNDHKPEFKVKNDTIYISERTLVGSVVYHANATDQDKDENGNIIYSIAKLSGEQVFRIDVNTGAVILNKTLDYEHTKQYSLRIKASDNAKENPKKSILRLYINILDSNDNGPIFDENPIFTHVFEGVERGTEVYKPILASDKDSGINSMIVYSIERQLPTAAFKIDPFKAQLSTDVDIDREDVNEYKLVVKAVDQAADVSQQKSNTVTVVILVSDINDCTPVFTSRNKSFIMEDEPVNFTVFYFTAEDKDLDQAGNVTFSLLEGNEQEMFHLDPLWGSLILMKPLDREKVDVYHLKIKASDQGSTPLFSTITFTLSVEDVNDNMPRFSKYTYKVAVPENSGTNNVLKVQATDLDSGQLNYSLPPGFADDLFIIDETSGQISTSSPLDREKVELYELIVYVQDNGYPLYTDSATVIISVTDKNDNVPQFMHKKYNVKVIENLPAGFICSIVAQDSDAGMNAQLHYAIEKGNVFGNFKIDESTGILSTVRPLDRESEEVHELTIKLSDSGHPVRSATIDLSILVLDENDNDPKFSSNEINISLPGSCEPNTAVVTLTATDDDKDATITYRFSSENQIPFALDSTSGLISTLNYFNASKTDVYSFVVNASDGSKYGARYGSVKVNVFIGRVTGTPLRFTRVLFEKNLDRQPKAGEEILQLVLMNDYLKLGDVEYTREDGQDVLAVNRTTGNVSFTQDPKRGAYLFSVKATLVRDRTMTAVCFVIVTVQHTIALPKFSKSNYYVTLNENDPRGTFVVAIKPHSPGNVSYQIVNGNDAFQIDRYGEVTVRSSNVLDFEKSPRLVLDVKGDWGNTVTNIAFTKVHVTLRNLNDKAPVFRQKVFIVSIPESRVSFDNRFVTKLLAYSYEGSQLSFTIVSGNNDNVFVLNSITGELSLRKAVCRAKKNMYNLTISVSTGVLSSKCAVLVFITDINNNLPQLPRTINFTISESSHLGTHVGQVNGTDKDEFPVITYSFFGDTQLSRPFIIDRHTGIISLFAPIDFETKPNMYSMDVFASDQANVNSTKVFVTVLDENDNAPLFEKSSYSVKRKETIPASSHLARINATDKDQGNNGKFTYNITWNEEIGIDPSVGIVYTKKELRYRKDIIDLIITATDQGSPPLSTQVPFRLQILDVNNKTPDFGNATYVETISEDTEIGTVVVTIKALNSASLSGNERISFQILHGNELKMFRIEERTGIIRVRRKLDRENNDLYNLVVVAKDDTSRITVRIKIDDVNDNAPIFQKNEYYVNGSMYEKTIGEDSEPPRLVLSVLAIDKDIGYNSLIKYSISSGNNDGWFSMTDNGDLMLVKAVDRDVIPIHRLSVTATDQGTPPRASDVSVVIKVNDTNDNAPVFLQPRDLGVAENSRRGTYAGTVQASDSDFGANQKISFSIINGTGFGLFHIERISGILSSVVIFDYEERSSYTLVVKAQDQGTPPRFNTLSIIVPILGVDEFEPMFLKTSYKFDVSTDAKKGETIGRVQAIDDDGGLEGVIKYGLKSPADIFAMNSSTGEIYLTEDVGNYLEHLRHKRDAASLNDRKLFNLTISASSGQPDSKINTITAQITLNYTVIPPVSTGPSISDAIQNIVIAISIVVVLAFLAFLVCLFVRCKRKKETKEKEPSEKMALRPIPSQIDKIGEPNNYVHVSTSASNSLASACSSSENRSSDTGYDGQSPSSKKQRSSNNAEIHLNSDIDQSPDSDIENSDTTSFDVRSDRTDRIIPRLQSIESLHDFNDQGGREARSRLDVGNILFAKLAEADAEEEDQNVDHPLRFHDEGRPDYTGSLSSILGSHEELRGHYNYFYALHQGPQYQPLSEVFSEIGRLPTSSKELGSHLNGVSDMSARTSILSSVSSLHNQHLDPECTYSSLPMTPNFTPAITPLVTRSPSLSPLPSEAVTPMVSPSQSRPSSIYLPRSRPASSLIQLAEQDALDQFDEDVHV